MTGMRSFLSPGRLHQRMAALAAAPKAVADGAAGKIKTQSLVPAQTPCRVIPVASLARPALSAAVDPQHLARHERAKRPGENLDHARDLVDGGDPVERAGFDQPLLIDRARARKRPVRVSPGAMQFTVMS